MCIIDSAEKPVGELLQSCAHGNHSISLLESSCIIDSIGEPLDKIAIVICVINSIWKLLGEIARVMCIIDSTENPINKLARVT